MINTNIFKYLRMNINIIINRNNNSNITTLKTYGHRGLIRKKGGQILRIYIPPTDVVKLLFLSCFGYSENFMRDLISHP